MARKVKYNGGTGSLESSFTDPSILVEGQVYELLYAKQYDWYTEFVLKGVEGKFNSVWFDGVVEYPQTFLAVSQIFPEVGERLKCYRAYYAPRQLEAPYWDYCSTSEVLGIRELGTNVFYVRTKNSAYIVWVP